MFRSQFVARQRMGGLLFLAICAVLLFPGMDCGGDDPTTSTARYPFTIRPYDLAPGVPFTLDATGTVVQNSGTVRHVWRMNRFTRLAALTPVDGFPQTTTTATLQATLPPGEYIAEHQITISDTFIDASKRTIRFWIGCGTAWTLDPRPARFESEQLFENRPKVLVPLATEGQGYSTLLFLSPGTMTFDRVTLSFGALPAGLTFDPATRLIEGTPAAGTEGSYKLAFTVISRCADSELQTETETFSTTHAVELVVRAPSSCAPLNINTAAGAPVGTATATYGPYQLPLVEGQGGAGTVTWILESGTLPPGLTLSESGAISGTPTTVGLYTFTVRATDSCAAPSAQSTTGTFSIEIEPESAIGWNLYKATGAGSQDIAAVVLATGIPAFVYSHASGVVAPNTPPSPGLWVAVANSSYPRGNLHWTRHQIASDWEGAYQAGMVDGRLCVAWRSGSSSDLTAPLLFAKAKVAVPASSADYDISTIADEVPAGWSSGDTLRVVNGQICLAWGGANQPLQLYQAATLSPAVPADWTVQAPGTHLNALFPILVNHGGRIVIAYNSGEDEDVSPTWRPIVLVESTIPAEAPEDWTTHEIPEISKYQIGLHSNGSRLVMSWGTGVPGPIGSAATQRIGSTTQAIPDAPDDWTIYTLSSTRGGSTYVHVHQGKLAVTYAQRFAPSANFGNVLELARALTDTPSSAANWRVDEVHRGLPYGTTAQLLSIPGRIAVAYNDDYDVGVYFGSHPDPY